MNKHPSTGSFRLVEAEVETTSEARQSNGSARMSIARRLADRWSAVKHFAKRYAPRRLLTRSLLIIVTPVVLTQFIVTYIFFELHWNTVTSRLSEGVAGDIAMLIDTYETFPSIQSIDRLTGVVFRTKELSIAVDKNAVLPHVERNSLFSVVDRSLRDALEERLNTPFWFDTTRYADYVDIRVQINNDVLRVYAPLDRVIVTNGHIFLLWMTVTSLVLLTIAIVFLRNQVRSIQRLAAAADHFGRGQDVVDFKPTGATEVRQAADAFLKMRDRIQRQIEQRTLLLAGVSHDLKTPLTRMRLELEMMGQPQETEAMRSDIAEMEHMLDEYLTFSRGQGAEAPSEIDLGPLTADIVQGFARSGQEVGVSSAHGLIASVRRNAIKRCITNLIENALRYGEKAAVRCERDEESIRIVVDDDGPGIPETQIEEAFKPFARLDTGRNLDAGGVGLGLAIARDVARGHGGDIKLGRSPWGGLRATLVLPV